MTSELKKKDRERNQSEKERDEGGKKKQENRSWDLIVLVRWESGICYISRAQIQQTKNMRSKQ